MISEVNLREELLDARMVSAADLERFDAERKKKNTLTLSEFILSEGKLKESELKRLEAHVLGIPYIELSKQKIEPEVLSLIPESIARRYNVVSYKKHAGDLEIALLDVDNIPAIDFIKKKTGLRILPRLTDSESIKVSLQQYRKSLQAEFDSIIQKEMAGLQRVDEKAGDETSEHDLKEMAEDLPVIKIVDSLVSHAISQSASDIHIEPGEHELIVRYRIDGILHDAMTLPRDAAPAITARIKVLSSLKLDEKRLPQDGRFKIMFDDQQVSFRVSTLPTYYGEKTVIRILRESSQGFTLEGLGFHGDGLESVHEGMKQHSGIILCSGPTGSGKTTTLYTVLDILNTPDVNISTIEDPIEYQMPRINQTQVKSEIGMTFANGLRALLRQDPNIIMVGEIRDSETASLAVNAALTGHLVLSTIHTNSAAGAIPRLIDMGVEPFLIVSTAKIIIAQRLVRQLTNTRTEYFLNDSELVALTKVLDLDRLRAFLEKEKVIKEGIPWEKVPFYKPIPDEESPDGYKGRLGIHEAMRISPAIKEIVLRGGSADEVEAQAKKEGMMTMLEDGIFQAVQGKTTIDEVLRVVSE
ncbi:Flp pilus assembly complex ATPase component TadA [Candidatus Nomurabacteria bacterium]|nr:Flp pilus assembly complex ATPase component TadA [Candidatus Nomurabacteria bacterium]